MKIANFTGKLLENYQSLECEIFRILLKHVSDRLSVFFYLHDCTFKVRIHKVLLVTRWLCRCTMQKELAVVIAGSKVTAELSQLSRVKTT